MIKKVFLLNALALTLIAAENNDNLQYIEARREQLAVQTREFDEAKQALEAYKASFEALQKEKLQALIQKEADINATLAKIEQTKAENEAILKRTQQNLATINQKTSGRIQEIYSQMKDTAVADVLSQMPNEDATKIMLSLEPRKISGILSKMAPQKASDLTLLIKNLDNNQSTQTPPKQ